MRGLAKIVWTAGLPNNHQGETESTLEKKEERGTSIGLYDLMMVNEQESHLIYMSTTYWLTIL